MEWVFQVPKGGFKSQNCQGMSFLEQIKLLSQWCSPQLNPYEEELDTTIAEFEEEEPCVTDTVEKTIPEYENLLPIQPEQLDMLDFKENIELKKQQAAENPDDESVYAKKQAELEQLEQLKDERDERLERVEVMREKDRKLAEMIEAQKRELQLIGDDGDETMDEGDDEMAM